ncbi:protein phosphatase methylesterase [Capsaspora owczarzaki ATCC 30864]|nr:protein phosphatase methylesterase [Capsaspora owczarzaki ATCC 30864]|eukprot:XP_004364660.2 protein phosphatase methylesterase [Capsaspora owczarzaki ATCC 30864]
MSLQREAMKRAAATSSSTDGSAPAAASSSPSSSFAIPAAARRQSHFSPLGWEHYFESSARVYTATPGNSFRVYRLGSVGPVLILLHGGGMCALSWSLFAKEVARLCACRIIAMDLREHGESHTTTPDDFSLDAMAQDVVQVFSVLYPSENPPTFVIGHSMGGAIATHIAAKNMISSLVGLVVLDVVEGSALDALSSMTNVIRNRPKSFKSVTQAIEWSLRTGHTHNVEAARVAMPGQVREIHDDGQNLLAPSISHILEEEAGESILGAATTASGGPTYVWRMDLSKTQPFWLEWFTGLSNKFLTARASKMLILAGMDRLDKELTIGQMQGKFQLDILPECGHSLHEDKPEKVGGLVAQHLVRHRFADPTTAYSAAKFSAGIPPRPVQHNA